MKNIRNLIWAMLAISASAHSLEFFPNRGQLSVPVKSIKEIQFGDVLRQQYDFSCGSAALASLLTYHYEQPSTEQTIFQVMFDNGNKELIEEQGFSMLDMKNYLGSIGLRADGFSMELSTIRKIGVPGITLVNFDGYMHFVVIKGINSDSVIIGDPSRGTITMSHEEFNHYYQNVVLLVKNRANIGRAHFITNDDFAIYNDSPLEAGVRRESLGLFSTTLPEAGEY